MPQEGMLLQVDGSNHVRPPPHRRRDAPEAKSNGRSAADYLEPPRKAAPTNQPSAARAKQKPPATHPWRTLLLAPRSKHDDKFTGQLT